MTFRVESANAIVYVYPDDRALRRPDPGEDFLEVEAADELPEDHHSDDEADVANAVSDECLVRGGACRVPFVIEADQTERARTDQFPTDEHLEQVVREDQVEHRETEERE